MRQGGREAGRQGGREAGRQGVSYRTRVWVRMGGLVAHTAELRRIT